MITYKVTFQDTDYRTNAHAILKAKGAVSAVWHAGRMVPIPAPVKALIGIERRENGRWVDARADLEAEKQALYARATEGM